MRTMYERIQSGEFENKYPYPDAGYYKRNGWDDKLKEERLQLRIAQQKVNELFKVAALEDVGLSDHTNADQIFSYAWEKGHSAGLYDVYQELDDLANLIHVIS